MDVGRPYASVSPGLEGDVLAVLARTTAPLTGREVARLAERGSVAAVAEALDRLAAQGLVDRQVAGTAYLHRLNREHVAAPAVELLAGLRGALVDRMRQALAAWPTPPVHASLFGSAARGDGDAESDIDLFVVRGDDVADESAWDGQLRAFQGQVRAWSGNPASVIEVGEDELRAWRPDPPSTLVAIREEGIHLAGVRLTELLRR